MPVIIAYKCPRTASLFEDKEQYLAHLKHLARASLQEKRRVWARAQIKTYFQDLAARAITLADFIDGLCSFAPQLASLQKHIAPPAGKLRKGQTSRIYDCELIEWRVHKNVRGEPSLGGTFNYKSTRDLDVYHASRESDNWKVLLIGKDSIGLQHYRAVDFAMGHWLFADALILYLSHTGDPYQVDEVHLKKLVDTRFPRIGWEQFHAMSASGLLPEDRDAFCNWLFSTCAEQALTTPSLPETVMEQEHF